MMTLSKTKTLLSAALMLTLAASVTASAQSSNALSGLFACQTVSNKDAQLACFLAETAKLRPAASMRSVPAVVPQRPAAPAPIQPEPVQTESVAAIMPQPVAPVQAQPAPQTVPQSAPLVKAKKQGKRTVGIRSARTYGSKDYYLFTLDNGEVWQQTQRAKVRVGKRSEPDVLVIAPASMGSSFARVNGKSPAIRVKRIR